jgi:hypothetical protein
MTINLIVCLWSKEYFIVGGHMNRIHSTTTVAPRTGLSTVLLNQGVVPIRRFAAGFFSTKKAVFPLLKSDRVSRGGGKPSAEIRERIGRGVVPKTTQLL